jgi:hypothetical protein
MKARASWRIMNSPKTENKVKWVGLRTSARLTGEGQL